MWPESWANSDISFLIQSLFSYNRETSFPSLANTPLRENQLSQENEARESHKVLQELTAVHNCFIIKRCVVQEGEYLASYCFPSRQTAVGHILVPTPPQGTISICQALETQVNSSIHDWKVLDFESCLPVILKLSLLHYLHQEDHQCQFLHLAFLLPGGKCDTIVFSEKLIVPNQLSWVK